MTNDPYKNKGAGQSQRRRRTERHTEKTEQPKNLQSYIGEYSPEDAAPLPLGSEAGNFIPPPQANRPEMPGSYDNDRYMARPSRQHDEDDDYEDDYAPRLWPKFLALFLGLVLIMAAGLYFLMPEGSAGFLGTVRGGIGTVVDGALGLLGMKESKAPNLIKLETPDAVGQIGVRTVFTFTTDTPVDSVRMVDGAGNVVMGQLTSIDQQNADQKNTVWTLAVNFEVPDSHTFRGEMLLNDVWYAGDKNISFMTFAPSPTPTVIPTPSFEPSPFPEITIDPIGEKPDPFSLTERAMAGEDTAAFSGLNENDLIVSEPEGIADNSFTAQAPVTSIPTAIATATAVMAKASPTRSPEPFVVLRNTFTPVPLVTEAVMTAKAEEPVVSAVDAPAWDEAQTDETAEMVDFEQTPQIAIGDETAQSDEPAITPAFNEWDEIDPAVLAAAAAAAAAAESEDSGTDGSVPGTKAVMPLLTMTADEDVLPSKFKLKEDVYQKAKKVKELERTNPLSLPSPQEYVSYEGGVFAFRNDNFRGNAAFGQADMPLEQMSILWQAPLGGLRVDGGETLYGLGYTGQPAIVKWSVELRQMMNISEDKKDVKALKEVIVAAQDGKVYFFDLNDGLPTREPIDIGYPLKGSVAVDTMGRPMISFGQGISKLAGGKTGPIGFYLYELIGQKELLFINGRKTKSQTQYSTNGAFDSSALFDRESDSMIIAGENGLFYTVSLNTVFDYLDKMTIAVDPVITYNKAKTGDQKDMTTTSEASVAMYGKYAFMADKQGILRAIDTDTMLTQWVFDTGDNTDASPALGFDEDGSLGLYTGTTVYSRTRKSGEAIIRKIDAMSGKELWQLAVPAGYDPGEQGGVKASPVVGEKGISDLVIFTVNLTGETKNATMIALNKLTGEEVWRFELDNASISSPVAVYNANGGAYLVQADEKGRLYLLRAASGELLNTLDLEGSLSASPAVYNDVLVIGTNSKDNSNLYGIRLE